MTDKETARIQGYDTRQLKLDPKISNNYFLIGNSMSVPVLERLWIATQRAQGFSADDPWANGVRKAQLIEAAQQDRPTPHTLKNYERARSTRNSSKTLPSPRPKARSLVCSSKDLTTKKRSPLPLTSTPSRNTQAQKAQDHHTHQGSL